MYAKVTNKTDRPIGLGLLTVLPDETVVVPESYQSNPTLIAMVESGELKGEKVKQPKSDKSDSEAETDTTDKAGKSSKGKAKEE